MRTGGRTGKPRRQWRPRSIGHASARTQWGIPWTVAQEQLPGRRRVSEDKSDPGTCRKSRQWESWRRGSFTWLSPPG